MSLETVLKIIGFAMAGIPAVIFVSVSASMMWKVGKSDDPIILVFVSLGLTCFFIGLGILALVYMGDLFFPS